MRIGPVASLVLLLPLAVSAAPTALQIDMAQRALTECQLAAPAALLDRYWLKELQDLQHAALHLENVRDDLAVSDQAIVARLRRLQRYELQDVYAADCLANYSVGLRRALGQMRAADPIVVRNAAFVPLVTPAGEYLGVGLSFILRDGVWRLEYFENMVLARDAKSLGISLQIGTRRTIEDHEVYASSCLADIPPAPMARLESAEDDIDDTEEPDDDAENSRGAAQRLAALRLAEGRGERPSIVAKVILAEILLRSLGFAKAPTLSSDGWRRRVERAERLLAEARLHSVDWLRMAPTLIWLARAHETGAGGLSIDPLLARAYLNLAAGTQDPVVAELIAERLNESWQPLPPSTDLRFAMPLESRGCE